MRSQAMWAALALTALAFVAAAGCGETQTAARPAGERAATPADLAIKAEAIGLQPEGGLPLKLGITVTNTSATAVAFTLPRPLVAEVKPPEGEEDVPLPVLGLSLKDVAGHEETSMLTDPKAKSWPKAKTVVLAPGSTWSAEYSLANFYVWGLRGPDADGNFTKYFWRGDTAITLSAVLVFGEGKQLASPPMTIRCKFEEFLFKRKPGN